MSARALVSIAALSILGSTPSAFAQRSGFALGFAGQQTSVDSVFAADRGISRTGVGAQLVVDIEFMKYLLTSFELGTLFYGDRRPFSQSVICIPSCSGGSKTSTISSAAFGMAVGLRTPRVRRGRVSAGASARAGSIKLVASRTIEGCSDCTKQDLGLKAGGYVEYGVNARYGKAGDAGVSLTAMRRWFVSSDAQFTPSLVLGIGVAMERP